MSKYRYTVIIPFYNANETIGRLLNTIPSRNDIQILVIDDNSDNTNLELFKTRSNLQYIVNDTGVKGAGSCRNIGLNHALGDFVLFCDADDYMLENAFNIFDEYYNSDFDIIYFKPTSICSSIDHVSVRHVAYEILVDDLVNMGNEDCRYKFYVPWSKLIRRSLIDENDIRFDQVIASNDVNFSLKVGFYAKRVSGDKRSIYCVVESNNSLTKKTSEEVIDSRYYAMCRYNEFLVNNNLKDKLNPMTFHLKNSLKFGIYKLLMRFFETKYYGYPTFHNLSSIKMLFRKYALIREIKNKG